MFLPLARRLMAAVALLLISLMLVSPVLAGNGNGNNGNGKGNGGSDPPTAPELDHSSSVAALALLAGGLLLLTDKRRLQKRTSYKGCSWIKKLGSSPEFVGEFGQFCPPLSPEGRGSCSGLRFDLFP